MDNVANTDQLLPCPMCGGPAKENMKFPGARNVWCSNQPDRCGNRSMYTREGWNTRHVPEGMAMVPVEPTKEIREAWRKHKYESCLSAPDLQWQAMIKAARGE